MTKSLMLYQVDAFADAVFRGNPAAVCPSEDWLADDVMQAVAAENFLPETAFVVPDTSGDADFGLRWFTPTIEMDLCGHATLATAWVLFHERGFAKERVIFTTKSGLLSVIRNDDGSLTMDFPQNSVMPAPHPDSLVKAIGGVRVLEFCKATNRMAVAVVAGAQTVRDLKPNMATIAALGGHGLIVTAKAGEGLDADADFVSRFFTPQEGIPEDPVTGSAHTVLAPFWAKRLKKDTLLGRQVSKRSGDVHCRISEDRVLLSGQAVLYLKGELTLP